MDLASQRIAIANRRILEIAAFLGREGNGERGNGSENFPVLLSTFLTTLILKISNNFLEFLKTSENF